MGADDTTDTTDTDSTSETAAPTQTTSADLTRLIDDVEGVLRAEPPPVEASSDVVMRRKPSWQTRKLGYQPGLDGLRAVAVGLVLAYHLGYSRAAGGYIGVELFFVLSGYLIYRPFVAANLAGRPAPATCASGSNRGSEELAGASYLSSVSLTLTAIQIALPRIIHPIQASAPFPSRAVGQAARRTVTCLDRES